MSTVLVYKTDITNRSNAKTIANAIRRNRSECIVSFDLEDCDNVLRVESSNGEIDSEEIKRIVEKRGFQIEILL